MKTKTCQHCKTVFERRSKASRAEWESRRFCSQSCGNLGHSTPLPSKVCLNTRCGKTFTKRRKTSSGAWNKQRFCSVGCGSAFRYADHQKHLQEEVAWIVDHDHPESVAKRVGYGKAEDLINKLRRTGAPELADKLARSAERYRLGEIGHVEDEFA